MSDEKFVSQHKLGERDRSSLPVAVKRTLRRLRQEYLVVAIRRVGKVRV
jgi:hypothetical protein